MNNKLFTLTFPLILSLTAWSQETDGSVVSAENKFYNTALDANNRIELYPNPAVDYIVVEINNSTLRDTEFELHSIIGNEIIVEAEDMGNGKFRIPVKEYATGYYFLVVKDEVTRFKKAYRFLKN